MYCIGQHEFTLGCYIVYRWFDTERRSKIKKDGIWVNPLNYLPIEKTYTNESQIRSIVFFSALFIPCYYEWEHPYLSICARLSLYKLKESPSWLSLLTRLFHVTLKLLFIWYSHLYNYILRDNKPNMYVLYTVVWHLYNDCMYIFESISYRFLMKVRERKK